MRSLPIKLIPRGSTASKVLLFNSCQLVEIPLSSGWAVIFALAGIELRLMPGMVSFQADKKSAR